MSENGDMLLLCDAPTREQIGLQLGDGRFVHHDDPYEALKEMGRRRWQAIVLTGARGDDLAGMVRAARRLQQDARLYALCQPADEPQVRKLKGGLLDDYFIYPPSRAEMAEIRRAANANFSENHDTAGRLSSRQIANLVTAAKSASSLERHLLNLLGEKLGVPLRWQDAAEVGPEEEPLLLTAGETPRVLIADKLHVVPDETEKFLAQLRDILPSLVEAARRVESLHRMAVTDSLTGAYNRRYFYHLTDQILLRARQRRFRVVVLLYDIDDFKRYNDRYGYAAGDEILRETAHLMKQITRSHDIVARIGGDEFAVLFWDAEGPRSPDSQPLQTAYALANRFREAVSTMEFNFLGPDAKGKLSISGGLATFPSGGNTCKNLLATANKAIRSAKMSGKNAIYLIGPDSSEPVAAG